MKNYLILSLLVVFTLFSNLFAQKHPEQFNSTKFSTKSYLIIDQIIKNKQASKQINNPVNLNNPNKRRIQPGQFTRGNFLKSKANTDELVYFYDSAFLYTTNGDITKLSSLRDAGGNILSELEQIWDFANSDWRNTQMYTYTYDDYGNALSVLFQNWETAGNDWVNVWKYRFTLDQYGNRITELEQIWSTESNCWINYMKGNLTYDNFGLITSYLEEVWETSSSNWINKRQFSFSYNTFGQYLSELSQDWSVANNDWINNERYTYTYDETVNLLLYLFETWDIAGSTWQNNMKFIYTYDVSGYMLSEIGQYWEPEMNNWANGKKNTFTNDESGNIISQLLQYWYIGSSLWENEAKGDFTYNSNGNLLSSLIQVWDRTNSRWVFSSKTNTTYDISGNELSTVLKMWDQVGWMNTSKYEYQYDYEAKKVVGLYYEWDEDWIPADANIYISIFNNYFYNEYETNKIEFYYSAYTSGIEDNAGKGNYTFEVYPNPAGTPITIKLNSNVPVSGNLLIYDQFGRLINEIPANHLNSSGNDLSIDVSFLAAGIYLVKLNCGGFYETQKLMIAK